MHLKFAKKELVPLMENERYQLILFIQKEIQRLIMEMHISYFLSAGTKRSFIPM